MRQPGFARLIIVFALSTGVASGFVNGASATYPGGNGKIAFIDASEAGAFSLVVANADGSDKRTLTGRGIWSVAWSPDGSRLAFTEARPRRSDREIPTRWALWVMDADGGNAREVVVFDSWLPDPAWSPDGTEIALPRVADAGGQIHALRLATGTWRPLTSTRGEFALHPSWSPDGTTIAFVSSADRRGTIALANADGSGTRSIAPGAAPEWSPDGSRLLIVRGGLVSMRPDGSDVRRLTRLEPGWDAGWSPDGTKVVFGDSDDAGVYVANADGTCPSLIPGTRDGHAPDWQPVPGRAPSDYIRCANLAVSATFVGRRATAGERIELAVSLVNRGNTAATDTRIVPRLGERFAFVDASGAACRRGERLVCSVGTLEPGEVARVRLTLIPRRGGRLRASVTGTSGTFESDPVDNRTGAELFVCSLSGTPGRDRIVGTAGHDVICAGAGADRIYGLGGRDYLIAGDGDDLLVGGPGNDRLDGGRGRDVILGGPGHDSIEAWDGEVDRIDGGGGDDSSFDDAVDLVRSIEFDTQGVITGRRGRLPAFLAGRLG